MVGSGTLITFPVLLALGYPPVTANVSNTIGLVPGSLSGAIGYRRELAGQRARAIRLGVSSALGGLTGAVALLVLPASAFKAIVPVFIALALVLVVVQPALSARLGARRPPDAHEGVPTRLAVFGDRRLRRLLRRGAGDHAARRSWAWPSPTTCSGSTR